MILTCPTKSPIHKKIKKKNRKSGKRQRSRHFSRGHVKSHRQNEIVPGQRAKTGRDYYFFLYFIFAYLIIFLTLFLCALPFFLFSIPTRRREEVAGPLWKIGLEVTFPICHVKYIYNTWKHDIHIYAVYIHILAYLFGACASRPGANFNS